MRTGIGFDVHPFAIGRPLVLGGVTVPHSHGLAGHSDADVLLHAVIDALLGSAALGDIGQHFPDTDEAWRGASSLKMLEHVCGLLHKKQLQVEHIDSVIMAQQPKLAPHIPAMREVLAQTLKLELDQVSVKATTTNGLGFIGRIEGIAAQAIATVGSAA